MNLSAKDMMAIAQVLYSRRLSYVGLAVSRARLEELSNTFAVLADEGEEHSHSFTLDVVERDA